MRALTAWAARLFLGISLAATVHAQTGVGVDVDEVIDNRMSAGMQTGDLEVRHPEEHRPSAVRPDGCAAALNAGETRSLGAVTTNMQMELEREIGARKSYSPQNAPLPKARSASILKRAATILKPKRDREQLADRSRARRHRLDLREKPFVVLACVGWAHSTLLKRHRPC